MKLSATPSCRSFPYRDAPEDLFRAWAGRIFNNKQGQAALGNELTSVVEKARKKFLMQTLNFLPAKDPLPVGKSYGLLTYFDDLLWLNKEVRLNF